MDGIKSSVVIGLLLAILGLGVTNTFFPRSSNLSKESVERIDAAVDQWSKMGDRVEENTKTIANFNQLMQTQLRARQEANDEGYDEQLRLYGLDIGIPTDDVNLRLYDPLNNFGRERLPRSQEQGTANTGPQAPTPGSEAKADGGSSRTLNQRHDAAAGSAG